MKVAIFYEKAEEKAAYELAAVVNASQCDAVCDSIDAFYDTITRSSEVLRGITHMVFVVPEKNTAGFEERAAFLLGLGCGRGLSLVMVRQEPLSQEAMPVGLKKYQHLFTTHTHATFQAYFDRERRDYVALEKKQRAYESLCDLVREPCFQTHFSKAVQEGQCELIQLFLDAGFSSSQRDVDGTPLLSRAVQHAQYEAVAFLLEHGADVNLCSEDRTYSALMEAVVLGSVQFAQLLLSHQADVNIQSKEGQTALILAVGRQDIPMVKLLLEHRADKNSKDKLGMSAFAYAKLFNNRDMLNMMETL